MTPRLKADVTLGAKPGLDRGFPPGTVQATEKLLVAIGADGRPDAGGWTGLMLWLQSELAVNCRRIQG